MASSPGYKELVLLAAEARQRAYAPYSKFQVGAAILTEDGRVFQGCNVENASFGATICAERSAVCAMVSAGFRNPAAIAICYSATDPALPCGICRQVLAEFNPRLTVLMGRTDGTFEETTLDRLLPGAFTLDK